MVFADGECFWNVKPFIIITHPPLRVGMNSTGICEREKKMISCARFVGRLEPNAQWQHLCRATKLSRDRFDMWIESRFHRTCGCCFKNDVVYVRMDGFVSIFYVMKSVNLCRYSESYFIFKLNWIGDEKNNKNNWF